MTAKPPIVRSHESAVLDDAVAYRIHRSSRMLLTHLHRFLADQETPLTPEKWFILARLHERGSLRQVELTEESLGDAPNVSRLVESLVNAGLVEREPDPLDRRSKQLYLSASGARLADDLLAAVIVERSTVFAGLDSVEIQAFNATLTKIDDNVRRLLTASAPRKM